LFLRVPKIRSLLWYWVPVLIWMALIFSVSGDAQSMQHSSRIIAPILRALFPGISEHTVSLVVLIARKCAHLTEYAVLAFLFWRARWRPQRNDPRPWSWRETGYAVLFVALYAASDEFHQSFVPTREASIHDVFIDTIGATVGMLGLSLLWKFRARTKKNPVSKWEPRSGI